jgi:hypothetical protein
VRVTAVARARHADAIGPRRCTPRPEAGDGPYPALGLCFRLGSALGLALGLTLGLGLDLDLDPDPDPDPDVDLARARAAADRVWQLASPVLKADMS